MKRIIFFSVLVIALAGCSGFSTISAVDYNNTIIAQQDKIVDPMINIIQELKNGDTKESRKIMAETKIVCDSSIAILEKLGPYKGDDAFRQKALELFKFYKKMFGEDFPKMIDIVETDTTFDSDIKIDELTDKMVADGSKLEDEMLVLQQKFAKDHNLIIEDNAKQKALDGILDEEEKQ